MDSELRGLIGEVPLPVGWVLGEVFHESCSLSAEDRAQLVGVTARRYSSCEAPEMVGSAAGCLETPWTRAYFELLERIAVHEAMEGDQSEFECYDLQGYPCGKLPRTEVFPPVQSGENWCLSLSNGVAIHRTWALAARNALSELIERDGILTSWFNLAEPPAPIPASHTLRRCFEETHRICFAKLPPVLAWSSLHYIVAASLLPFAERGLHAFGFGCASSLVEASAKAETEVIQMFGFLKDEPFPAEVGPIAATPSFHHRFFHSALARAEIRRWLGAISLRSNPPQRNLTEVSLIDITPPHFPGAVRVCKAMSAQTLPLIFGDYERFLGRSIREGRRIHPVA